MRSLLRSLLAFLTLGMGSTACTKSEAPPTPRDVVLIVPKMH